MAFTGAFGGDQQVCKRCDGDGELPYPSPHPCPDCRGRGWKNDAAAPETEAPLYLRALVWSYAGAPSRSHEEELLEQALALACERLGLDFAETVELHGEGITADSGDE